MFGVEQHHLKQGGGYKTTLCKFFLEGICLKGEECTFSHGEAPAAAPKSDDQVPCKFFAQGICMKGTACPFLHAGPGGCAKGGCPKGAAKGGCKGPSPTAQIPCKFYAVGTCAKGWECPFAHGPGG